MELLFLLLPLAALSGWWLGRRQGESAKARSGDASPAFFRGLNYLLNEQPDKAIDVFLKLSELDGDTAETHLALGALFRRRGEVDRAIRIHQNLVARDQLGEELRAYALYELARDYLQAGLLDRAEGLFAELVEMEYQQKRALRGLIEIYQAEKEWGRCLEMARRLDRISDNALHEEIAHYHCELAETALEAGDAATARSHLLDAHAADKDSVRAGMLQAQMELSNGDAATASMLYLRLVKSGSCYLPAMLPGLLQCWDRTGKTHVADALQDLFDAHPSTPLMLSLSEALERERGADAAIRFLDDYIGRFADLVGIDKLLSLHRALGMQTPSNPALSAAVRQLLSDQPGYRCNHCGFEARALHWQCPSCKHWGSIRAIEPRPVSEPLLEELRQLAIRPETSVDPEAASPQPTPDTSSQSTPV